MNTVDQISNKLSSYRDKNKEVALAREKKYRSSQRAKELSAIRYKRWKEKNKETNLLYQKQYGKENRTNLSLYQKEYREKNKEILRVYRRNYRQNRLKTDQLFKIQDKFRLAVLNAFKRIGKNKTFETQTLLGCSFQEAKAHIESLWTEGMNWENHSIHGWHIDHIRPISSFKEHELHLMNHITNLQPLWAAENYTKSGKFNE